MPPTNQKMDNSDGMTGWINDLCLRLVTLFSSVGISKIADGKLCRPLA